MVLKGETIRRYDSLDSIEKTGWSKREFLDLLGHSETHLPHGQGDACDELFLSGLSQDGAGRVKQLYISERGSAAAVVCTGANGIAWLQKFAIKPEMTGHCVRDSLWETIKLEHPNLCWRVCSNTQIEDWWFHHADGFKRGETQQFFWVAAGEKEWELAQASVEEASNFSK